ncbi:ACP S-malonyltransferase [Candidatus Profftia sp. (ex Adelges kitamiensis)]|uniref:ACP S-malonyltransferase n=1 Tax=Candidatus Profftia sp. (ex Adelges kitamiensis) TaxID=2864218 RepID=UPI001CE345C4|nr:ACP S-malonyltransferase [Candidatus Profftia sp. (ex Adelges kitamiensis)]
MPKVAMIFPGQGAQTVGMLADLANKFSIVKHIFSEASIVLGYDLWKLVQDGPAKKLNQTWKTQPALLAASISIYSVWQQHHGPQPIIVAGHSLGEYSALVCANVLDFQQAILLVELRGKLMNEAVPAENSAMFAILGLNKEKIIKVCLELMPEEMVFPVNFNSPSQVVIAGDRDAVERASILCMSIGAKRAIRLPVNVPSHCIMMKTAAEKLLITLKKIKFNVPKFAVINNVDVKVSYSPSEIRNALVRQMYNPVLWNDSIELIASLGVKYILEVGPGNILTSLAKRTITTTTAIAINDSSSLSFALAQVQREI